VLRKNERPPAELGLTRPGKEEVGRTVCGNGDFMEEVVYSLLICTQVDFVQGILEVVGSEGVRNQTSLYV
jgi:hypothetical protein